MRPGTTAAAALFAVVLSSTTALDPADAARPGHDAVARADAYRVTATVNNTEPLVDTKVKIKGTVSPAAPGAKVKIQRKAEGRTWKSIGHAVLSNNSKYKFKDKLTKVTTRKYRVIMPADARHGAGRDTTEKVVVYGWRDLTSLVPDFSNNMYEVKSVSMNGIAYPNSLQSAYTYFPYYAVGNIQYNLRQGCKVFRATVGLSDSSPANGTVHIEVYTDSTPRYSGSFALTQSAPVTIDVTYALRFTIAEAYQQNGLAAIGTPQVLCSF